MAKHRKMLSDWEAPYIQSLLKAIEGQSKETLLNWVLGYAERKLLPLWKKHYPDDKRPEKALQAARNWREKKIKLPEAKKFILECHAAARDAEIAVAQAAARAIAQSASSIHVARHCIGLPLYGAVSVAYDELGTSAPWPEVEKAAAREVARMEEALKAISVPDEPNPAKIDWNC